MLVAVTNVDAQKRQKEEMARIQSEKTVYSRISALAQGFICIYTVDPATGHFKEYRASSNYADLGISAEGDDFFGVSRENCKRFIYEEDQVKFQTLLTRENVMEEIAKTGYFSMRYRLMMDGEPRYMNLRAVLVEEQEGPLLIIGVNDIDTQIRREREYERRLSAARSRANLDELTGVKTKSAYQNMSEHLSRQIEDGQNVQYAIALCRD